MLSPEFGHFCLVLALVVSGAQIILPMVGLLRDDARLIRFAEPLQHLASLAIFISFASLVYAFIVSDFSVQLVASHSHSLKPMIYKITGSWGNHEGSLLLWIVILGLFGMLFVVRETASRLKTLTLMVMGGITLAFLAFSLFTSNPFTRLSPAPPDGRGLNPVLQDIGLALHPPMLYLGYVGLSVAFALAIAGLITGEVSKNWARITRFWVVIAWSALTAGIALGSWWAYYELGWGGWWFWDPVENASLMPWLAATALLHSVIVVEKRQQMVSWTLLMAITAFSLSLVGTFIVRSGLLTSVHSFASDPARGIFILFILLGAVGLPLFLYAFRAGSLTKGSDYALLSRETGLIINNYILVVSTFIVLIGTFYPLALELFTGAKITVGAPYFDATFNPVMGIGILFMAIGPLLVWRRGMVGSARPALLLSAAVTGIAAIILMASSGISVAGIAGIALTLWLALSIGGDMLFRLRPWQAGIGARLRLPATQWGMWLAHFGMVIFLIGALASALFEQENVVRVNKGTEIALGNETVIFDGVEERIGPNYVTETALLRLFDRDGKLIDGLYPEKRFYPSERQTTTEAAIRTRLSGDHYAVLGDGSAESGYTLRLYHKPLVSWIWFGAVMMAMGGLVALYRRPQRAQKASLQTEQGLREAE